MTKEGSPFTPGTPVPKEYFIGRATEIERLSRAIRKVNAGKNANVFLMGERGIGKSSLANLIRKLGQKDCNFIGAHCFINPENTLGGCCRIIFKRLLEEMPANTFEKAKEIMLKYIKNIGLSSGLIGFNIEFTKDEKEIEELRVDFLPILRKLFYKSEKKGIIIILDDLNGLSKTPDFALWLKSLVDEMATSSLGQLPLLLVLVGTKDVMADMLKHQPSVGRIFDVVELNPFDKSETRKFFKESFERVKLDINETALETLAFFSGGLPVIMQELGDATFWLEDEDETIDSKDAMNGVFLAAENIGRKYLDPKVYKVIRSKDYLTILRKLPEHFSGQTINRSEILAKFSENENKKVDNFLRKMKDLGMLIPGEQRGDYSFANNLYPLYIKMEAERATRR